MPVGGMNINKMVCVLPKLKSVRYHDFGTYFCEVGPLDSIISVVHIRALSMAVRLHKYYSQYMTPILTW